MIKDALVRNIFTNIKEPALILCVKSGKAIIEAANHSYTELMELTEEKLLGIDLFSSIALEDSLNLMTAINRLGDDNPEEHINLENYSFKTSFATHQQQPVNVRNILLSSSDSAGNYILHTVNPIQVSGSGHISMRPLAENLGQPSEKLLAILEAVGEGAEEPFVLLDSQLHITFCNKKFHALYKEYYGKAVEVGRSIIDYAKEERRDLVAEIYKRVLSGKREQSEIITEVSTNVFKKLILDFKPIIGASGAVESIFVSGTDITVQRNTEQRLEENERELGFIYDNLHYAVFVIGVTQKSVFKFISANKTFLQLVDMPAKIVVGTPIDQVIPKARIKTAIARYKECIASSKSLSWEEVMQYPSGEKTVIVTVTPVFDTDGCCEKLIGSIHDISDHKELEKIAEATNRKLSKILESSPDVICTLDEFGRFLSLNAASQRMWGYAPEQLEGKYCAELLHREDVKEMRTVLSQIVGGVDISHFENRLRRMDGTYIPLVWSARWDNQERIIYCVAKDGTEKQVAEDNLKISEQRFKTLVQDGSDLISILDSNGNYLYVSHTSQSVMGKVAEEYLGKNAFDFIHPDDKESTMEKFGELNIKQKIELPPYRFLHNDGSWRWMETVITDLTEDPAIKGIVANSRDITEKINVQRDTLLSKERYRFATRATSDAVWDWNLETNKVYWGHGFQRIFHWQPNQLSADISSWANLVHPEDLPNVEKKLSLFLESSEIQWSDEYRFARAEGGFNVVSDRRFVVRDNTGKATRVVGAMQDVSRQRRKEHQLKLLESVVTHTDDLVMITEADPESDEKLKIIYVNEAFCQLTGYTVQELIGGTPRLLIGEKTDRKELNRLSKSLQKFESCEVSVINYKKNGEEFWNNFSMNPVADERGVYTHWISIGRDISDLINLQNQERIISSVSEIFNRTDGLVEAMEKTMKLLTKSGKYVYGEIWMLDHDALHLSLMGRHALCPEQEMLYKGTDLRTKVKKAHGFAGEVWKAGKIQARVISENKEKIFTGQTVLGTIFGLPLFYNKEPIGVLVLGSQVEEVQTEVGIVSEKFGLHLGAEIRRKQLEQELGQIFNFAPDIIAISDFDGYFKKVNPAASILLGYTTEELMSKPFTEFLHPEDRNLAIDRVHPHGIGTTNYFIEERYLTKTGEIKWLAWTSHAIVDRGLIFSVAKDITDKKNLEELLARSNSLAKVGSWEINVLAGTVFWSDVTREIREADPGFEPDLNTGIDNFRKDVDKLTIRRKVDECIAYGLPWDEELEILTFKGNEKWVRTIGQAEMVDGKCTRIFGSFQDIDTRKRAEIKAKVALEDLEESEKRYSDLFHLSPNPMWVYNYETLQFMDVNEMALSHYGYSYEEFMGMTLRDIRPESQIPAMEDTVEITREEGCQFYMGIFKHQKKNGEIIDVEIKSNVVNFKGQKAKLVLVNDITERQKYLSALKKQNKVLGEISWVQSHMVRAPLAKLMGLVALLGKRSMRDLEKQKILTENIEHCTAELDHIIREITKKSEQQENLSRL
ncbi:PAS domain S-box-containing protein [Pedobacter sp. UYP30]|uniref:PAS domain S-box protein n=1 Tax=Pedobacter sp. UYP30 TaxID=1756400 RepID=UPI003398695B